MCVRTVVFRVCVCVCVWVGLHCGVQSVCEGVGSHCGVTCVFVSLHYRVRVCVCV